MISKDIESLRTYLLGHIDASPKLELHINSAKNSAYVVEMLEYLAQQARVLEAGIVPPHLRPADDIEHGGSVISLAAYRKNNPKKRNVK